MKSVAFITYNTVGDGLASGWHERDGRRAFVLQSTNGSRWGARENPDIPSGSLRTTEEYADRVRGKIEAHWDELQGVLHELDHAVIYVGSRGSERAIELATQLPVEKVTLVSCECGVLPKTLMLMTAGFPFDRVLVCECGGHQTMRELFESFMATGEFQPVLAA